MKLGGIFLQSVEIDSFLKLSRFKFQILSGLFDLRIKEIFMGLKKFFGLKKSFFSLNLLLFICVTWKDFLKIVQHIKKRFFYAMYDRAVFCKILNVILLGLMLQSSQPNIELNFFFIIIIIIIIISIVAESVYIAFVFESFVFLFMQNTKENFC